MRRTARYLVLFSAALLGGCQSDHLFFTTYTKIGLDVSASDGQPTQAVFGYKRFEGAIIPVDVNEDVGETPEGEEGGDGGSSSGVASVFASIEVENSWLSGLKINQVFATGTAAKRAAGPESEFVKAMAASRHDNNGDEE